MPGFRVLAVESSLFQCHVGDDSAAASDPGNTLMRSLIGVWHTREVLPLFERGTCWNSIGNIEHEEGRCRTTSVSPRERAEIRDQAVADNLAFVAGELFPGQKIEGWGHNYHVRHDNAAIPPQADVFPGAL